MPYCPFCGSETSEEDSFCGSCGAMLNGGVAPGPVPKGPDGKKVFATLLVMSILLAAIAGAVVVALLNAGDDTRTDDITRTYRWTYNDSTFRYTVTVDRPYYDRMMSSQIDRTGTVSADRYIENGKTVFGVCDYVVVDDRIKSISDDLQELYKAQFGDFATNDDYVKFVTAFVQICIDYDYTEANSGVEYWRYPLETLCDGKGDCEDTSILLASLLDAKGLGGGVLLIPSHAMCAIDYADLTCHDLEEYGKSYYSSVYDVNFYPIETTFDSFHTIGSITSDYKVIYLHLYMGSSADYYFKS